MVEAQKILAIDTAMNGCNVCVYNAQTDKAVSRRQEMQRGQAEYLIPAIQEIMEEAGCAFADLTDVITTIGPGTFTGLRIGMSTAKSFGLSLDVRVTGITTLQALAITAAQMEKHRNILCLVETKRDDFYAQFFDREAVPLSEARSMSGAAIDEGLDGEILMVGDAVSRFLEETREQKTAMQDGDVKFADMEQVSRTFLKNSDDVFTDDISPVYLRGADVSFSKKKHRVLEG